jgi:hypothetical protein
MLKTGTSSQIVFICNDQSVLENNGAGVPWTRLNTFVAKVVDFRHIDRDEPSHGYLRLSTMMRQTIGKGW